MQKRNGLGFIRDFVRERFPVRLVEELGGTRVRRPDLENDVFGLCLNEGQQQRVEYNGESRGEFWGYRHGI